jgi:DNA-binding transcriptional regulator YdaS (Cro superfamily)
LDIGPSSATVLARAMGSSFLHRATATPPPPSEASDSPHAASQASVQATLSQMEQIRLLVLGMEQRMQEREGKLTKTIERAEVQEVKCEALRKEVLPTKVAA